MPDPVPKDAEICKRQLPKQYLAAGGLLLVAAISSTFLAARAEIHPQRAEFASFPMKLGDWQGKSNSLEKIYLDTLKLDDYILADYVRDGKSYTNLYVAYYVSQRTGESAHSPRSCIPGGGWRIMSITPHLVDGVKFGDAPLRVNRLVIQKGEYKQLVYYWFQQRGRIISNEYLVKWYLFWDALTRNRTDGSMVRLTTILRPGEDISEGDRRLASFAKLAAPELRTYIPE